MTCKLAQGYLSNSLNLRKQLRFLFHVEECRKCWYAIYYARMRENFDLKYKRPK